MFNVTDQCFMFPALRSFFVYEYNIYKKIEVEFAKFLPMSRRKDMILFAENL